MTKKKALQQLRNACRFLLKGIENSYAHRARQLFRNEKTQWIDLVEYLTVVGAVVPNDIQEQCNALVVKTHNTKRAAITLQNAEWVTQQVLLIPLKVKLLSIMDQFPPLAQGVRDGAKNELAQAETVSECLAHAYLSSADPVAQQVLNLRKPLLVGAQEITESEIERLLAELDAIVTAHA